MPRRNGTWEHKWFVSIEFTAGDNDEYITRYELEEEAWQHYVASKNLYYKVQYGEMYVFVPKEEGYASVS